MRVASFRLSIGQTARDVALWRKAVTALAAASFFWLSLLAQTHIHHAADAPSATAVKILPHAGDRATPAKAPPSGDTSDCPLCQAVGHGAAFMAPLFVALIVVPQVQDAPFRGVVSAIFSLFPGHDRQSRAPPHL